MGYYYNRSISLLSLGGDFLVFSLEKTPFHWNLAYLKFLLTTYKAMNRGVEVGAGKFRRARADMVVRDERPRYELGRSSRNNRCFRTLPGLD